MADLSRRVDIVELKPGTYRRWRNDLEVALILAQCLPAAEHAQKPDNVAEDAWSTMERNARAIVIKGLRDEYWRVSAQDSVHQILRKIEDAYQPTSSLIAILNICRFFSLSQGTSKSEDAVKDITASFAEMQRSIQASQYLAPRVNIDENVRTAVLAFAVEKSDPAAAQQIKERFERNAISFDQAVSLIAEVRVTTTSSSTSPFLVNVVSQGGTCSYCNGRHSIDNCWFNNPSLASKEIRAKGICRICKRIGHHTKDCKKDSSKDEQADQGKEKKKHAFMLRHVALANSASSSSSPSIIIDSGCTTHMVRDKCLFTSYTEGPPSFAAQVFTASGQSIAVNGHGAVCLLIQNARNKGIA